jgi:hypothetical protein
MNRISARAGVREKCAEDAYMRSAEARDARIVLQDSEKGHGLVPNELAEKDSRSERIERSNPPRQPKRIRTSHWGLSSPFIRHILVLRERTRD